MLAGVFLFSLCFQIFYAWKADDKPRQKPHQDTLQMNFEKSKNNYLLRTAHKTSRHYRTMKPGQVVTPPKPALPALPKEHYGCELCIAFWNSALNNLIQILENVGVGATCAEICGELPQQWEADACMLFCQIVGEEYFGELINDIDPDPIWTCMELYACPSATGVTGNITSIRVSPLVGPVGATFTVTASYKVFQTTGTGMVVLWFVAPGDGFEFGFAQEIIALPPGSYSTSESFSSAPTEEAPFYDGTYTVFAEVCEGTCGGTHGGEYQIALDATLFNMVN